MRSLFLKIFVWFWAAMALVGAVLILLIIIQDGTIPRPGLRGPGPPPPGGFGRHRAFTGESISIQAQRSVELFETEGREAVAEHFGRLYEASGVQSFFFDSNGHEVVGRGDPPAEVEELARRALETGGVEFQPGLSGLLVAARAGDERGNQFVLVGLLPRRLLGGGFNAGELALRFLAVLATAGALCYGLARYLTAPMAKLQSAARQLGSGDLGTRVDPRLRQRQDEFGELGRDFDRMAERIEQLLRSQQRLLGDISHELRSPLARLLVALELARKKTGVEAAGALNRIERESDRMNELIGQLLRLTRLEADATVPEKKPVALHSLINEIAEDADFEARGQGRSVSVKVLGCQPCDCLGSAKMLRSAIENIVRNAVHYSAEETSVQLSLQTADNAPEMASITVRDHGPGVPDETLANLFRPFYRVDDARARESGGIGLGLAITQRIVQLHQGEVSARNAAGGGLLVEIRLPVTMAPDEA